MISQQPGKTAFYPPTVKCFQNFDKFKCQRHVLKYQTNFQTIIFIKEKSYPEHVWVATAILL